MGTPGMRSQTRPSFEATDLDPSPEEVRRPYRTNDLNQNQSASASSSQQVSDDEPMFRVMMPGGRDFLS